MRTTCSTTSKTPGCKPKIDVSKTFAGQANVRRRCHCPQFRLMSAAQPTDFFTGWDLRKTPRQQELELQLDQLNGSSFKGSIAVIQDNTNYVWRKIVLLMRHADC